MRKSNTNSAQFNIIQNYAEQVNESAKYKNPIPNMKLSKQNQEFINNTSASGLKQFHKI